MTSPYLNPCWSQLDRRNAMASVPNSTQPPAGWTPSVPISRLRQFGVNLRIWLPLLSNRSWETRELKYTARENRHGARWQVSFPACCWHCQANASLEFVRLDREVRGFENPLGPIILCPLAAVLAVAIAITIRSPTLALLAPAVLALGAFWLWFKSSTESVELSVAACALHRLGVQEPDLAVFDNELYVFAHSPELALAARQEQTATRRAGRSSSEDMEPPSNDRRPQSEGKRKRKSTAENESAPPALPPVSSRREELPPIKLDD